MQIQDGGCWPSLLGFRDVCLTWPTEGDDQPQSVSLHSECGGKVWHGWLQACCNTSPWKTCVDVCYQQQGPWGSLLPVPSSNRLCDVCYVRYETWYHVCCEHFVMLFISTWSKACPSIEAPSLLPQRLCWFRNCVLLWWWYITWKQVRKDVIRMWLFGWVHQLWLCHGPRELMFYLRLNVLTSGRPNFLALQIAILSLAVFNWNWICCFCRSCQGSHLASPVAAWS